MKASASAAADGVSIQTLAGAPDGSCSPAVREPPRPFARTAACRLRDHSNNAHASRLEWVIIWLIVIEVSAGCWSAGLHRTAAGLHCIACHHAPGHRIVCSQPAAAVET